MSYDLMFQKAIELQNNGALNEAEEIYLKMLQAMPENSDVWNLLGLVAQSKGNLTRAEDCFLNAIKYAPKPFAPHFFNLSLTYKSLKKHKEALEAMQRACKIQPDMREAWNYLGILQAENNDTNNAVKSFCKALEIDDNYTDARANLCFYTHDKEALFNLAQEETDNFQVNMLAAQFCDNDEQKEQFLRQAIASDPYHTGGLTALATFLVNKGNTSEALTLFHKALNLDETSLEAILGIADIYLAANELEKAEKYYLKSFQISRDIVGAHLNYGILLYRQQRFNEALEEYRKAAILSPEKPEISYNLALILKETGDLEEALGLMFNAHLKDINNETYAINIMETLAELYENNAELALKIAENWQKQEPDNLFSKRLFSAMSGLVADLDDATYAKKLFDNFADKYDETLEKLEPQIISKFKELNSDISGRILDLGCGTGLAALALKNEHNCFDGVDISENMLNEARKKSVYENLFLDDIFNFVSKNRLSNYDLVVAFDVFCYFGAFDNILKKLKHTPLWFSVELADDSRGKDFYLAPNGRYKHRKSYLERSLKSAGYKDICYHNLVLRKENGHDVLGLLISAK